MASETLISRASHPNLPSTPCKERAVPTPVPQECWGECGLKLPQVGVGGTELKSKPTGLNVGVAGETVSSQRPSAPCPAAGAQRSFSLQQAKVLP